MLLRRIDQLEGQPKPTALRLRGGGEDSDDEDDEGDDFLVSAEGIVFDEYDIVTPVLTAAASVPVRSTLPVAAAHEDSEDEPGFSDSDFESDDGLGFSPAKKVKIGTEDRKKCTGRKVGSKNTT